MKYTTHVDAGPLRRSLQSSTDEKCDYHAWLIVNEVGVNIKIQIGFQATKEQTEESGWIECAKV